MDETIEIDRPIPPPRLPGKVVLGATADDVIDAIAADILARAAQSVRISGDFHLALSGGSTPLPLYRRLMYDTMYRQLPWSRTHLWIVDERCVTAEDDRSNFKGIQEMIVHHADIPPAQVHPMQPLEADADVKYEQALRESLAHRAPGQQRLDYVVLGMGGDAHTASLFPGSDALEQSLSDPSRWVRFNRGERVTPPDRLTMTYALLNAAGMVGTLVLGEGKRPTITRVSEAHVRSVAHAGGVPEHSVIRELPILGVRPAPGEMRWYLDYAACPKV